jgi:transcription initiation factor TFIIIB Brf1 subunit/transcription initiation factor TFIIB
MKDEQKCPNCHSTFVKTMIAESGKKVIYCLCCGNISDVKENND